MKGDLLMWIASRLETDLCPIAIEVVVAADKTVEQIIANAFEFFAPSHVSFHLLGMARTHQFTPLRL